ncbi:MAG: helix-turn-helix domain-containing protein [Meiothermus sp.]|uniref:helix-turn-helix domain-containing protein n=1 Tax=Meiothermus sp. TaxID=1955249 RepID=UPI0025D58679|nr:helix-turn-helix domain-containing protein [Meiothermus sp.]MCS7069696.1 helix-turn-helix domain-containing protein [Meiothermus sp.]MCX7783019.1 helix-turn-helix domain-containing protein [Meiothermus sp.]
MEKVLLTVRDLQKTLGWGRDTCYKLAKSLPHVKIGSALYVRSEDVRDFVANAAKRRADVRAELAGGGVADE